MNTQADCIFTASENTNVGDLFTLSNYYDRVIVLVHENSSVNKLLYYDGGSPKNLEVHFVNKPDELYSTCDFIGDELPLFSFMSDRLIQSLSSAVIHLRNDYCALETSGHNQNNPIEIKDLLGNYHYCCPIYTLSKVRVNSRDDFLNYQFIYGNNSQVKMLLNAMQWENLPNSDCLWSLPITNYQTDKLFTVSELFFYSFIKNFFVNIYPSIKYDDIVFNRRIKSEILKLFKIIL